MGCDIHVHFECKINGKWQHYSSPRIGRRSDMFGKMAGVRRKDTAQITELKGLPDDMSDIVASDAKQWELEGFGESWFNLNELIELEKWCNERYSTDDKESEDAFSDIFGYLHGQVITSKSTWLEGIEDVRMIFWFDN